MKVLYFTRTQSPHDLRFTQALAETDHQVFVLCLESVTGRQWPGNIVEIEWAGIDTKHGLFKIINLVERLRRGLRILSPDLVHAGPIQSASFLTALAGFHPLVSMSWGSDLMMEADKNWSSRFATTYALKRTDVLVGDCACVVNKAESFGYKNKPYYQFPWGVDLQHFSPLGSASLRKKLDWQGKVILLSNRAFEPLYGVDIVLKAFSTAYNENQNLRLLLFGKGSLEAQFRQFVIDHDLVEKVHFGGHASLDQLPDVYRSSDIYLSASHSDGSSVSLMEALACGLPVLVSDIPGNLEWVTEGKHGWLFQDGDDQGLSQKIILASSQIKMLDPIKKGNRVMAETRADWNKNFKVLLETYEAAYALRGSHD